MSANWSNASLATERRSFSEAANRACIMHACEPITRAHFASDQSCCGTCTCEYKKEPRQMSEYDSFGGGLSRLLDVHEEVHSLTALRTHPVDRAVLRTLDLPVMLALRLCLGNGQFLQYVIPAFGAFNLKDAEHWPKLALFRNSFPCKRASHYLFLFTFTARRSRIIHPTRQFLSC